MKRCSRCGIEQSLTSFHKSTARGTQAWCRACCHEYRVAHRRQNAKAARLRNYGLTASEFEALLADQSNCCASCRDPLSDVAHDVHVDHCHETGVVRGVLCRHCNIALGHLRDSPERIRALLRYIEPCPS